MTMSSVIAYTFLCGFLLVLCILSRFDDDAWRAIVFFSRPMAVQSAAILLFSSVQLRCDMNSIDY